MTEDFLHYIWKYQLQPTPMTLTSGKRLEVLSAGVYNTDSGPDFFNAKIQIDDIVWVGNIEIHINASDWYKHQHQHDDAYNNVILHVVKNNDKPVTDVNGNQLPTLEIVAPEHAYQQYNFLMKNNNWVPCETFINKIDYFTFLQSKEALLVERLQDKTKIIAQRLSDNKADWEETTYQTLAINFGIKTNALPFEILAKTLPLNYLAKHRDQLDLLEAMLFGQAGLIPKQHSDSYVKGLQQNYQHLANKFGLMPLDATIWKFMRLRPPNFPTIRISQFAQLIHKNNSLFSQIIEVDDIKQLQDMFSVQASKFWDTHYSFNKESDAKPKRLGKTTFYNIIINSVVPIVFLYGREHNNQALINKSLQWLSDIPAEQNSIVKQWKKLGVTADNAFDTQALIQLKNTYCNSKKCLNCKIGNKVIRHLV